MSKNILELKIAHLYPDLLNIYGDLGNILTFTRRCQWRNIKIEVVQIKSGDKIHDNKYDFFFIGGGQDAQQILAANELYKNSETLKKAANNNIPMLAICGGYQLFGNYYKLPTNERLQGIGLLDVITTAGNKRFIGNVTAINDFLEKTTIVGFENHSGITTLGKNAKPLFKIKIGNGNNGKDKTEGARFRNVFGTYLHGPLLPKNSHFCDYLISLAMKNKYHCEIPLENINDDVELYAHDYMVDAKYRS